MTATALAILAIPGWFAELRARLAGPARLTVAMARGEPSQRPYKQVARAKAQEQTRETLLQAATEEVEQDSWSQASLESVAGRAGVSKQTVLRHFGSKQGLLDAVISRTGSIMVKERNEAPIGDIPGAVANLMRHYERYGDIVVRLLPYRDAVVRVMGSESRNSLVRAVDYGHEVHERVGPAHIRAAARGPRPAHARTAPGAAGGDLRRVRVENPAARHRPGEGARRGGGRGDDRAAVAPATRPT